MRQAFPTYITVRIGPILISWTSASVSINGLYRVVVFSIGLGEGNCIYLLPQFLIRLVWIFPYENK